MVESLATLLEQVTNEATAERDATITALKSENENLAAALELMLTHGEYSNWFANRGDDEVVDQARAALAKG